MSVKSINVPDNELQALLAQQAYLFNVRFTGSPFDPYIYDGLYEAVNSFEGQHLNELYGHKDAVRSVAYNSSGEQFFSAGSDGTIRIWDFEDPSKNNIIVNNGTHPNRVIKVSPDGKWLAAGSDSTSLQLVNLEDGSVQEIGGHKALIYDLEFAADNSGIYSLSHDKSIRFYDYKQSRLLINLSTTLKTFEVSPDNSFIIGGSKSGQLVRIDLGDLSESVLYENPNVPIHSVDISPNGRTLAFGDEQGIMHIWDVRTNIETNTLRGHTARINVVKFSPDGKRVGSGSYDGSVQLYIMSDLTELPIVMKDHNSYVMDFSFDADNNFLVAATYGGILKVWPTKSDYFAKDMCSRLTRNMNATEWNQYVPSGINYTITCSSFNSGPGGD